MILTIAVLLTVAALVFTFSVRQRDLPEPEPVSPTEHLEQRKSRIYEGLRDLQFEYLLGKLSDADYQASKVTLQKELAGVIGEIDRVTADMPKPAEPVREAAKPKQKSAPGTQCPHCNATFAKPMKFCGECGKAMA